MKPSKRTVGAMLVFLYMLLVVFDIISNRISGMAYLILVPVACTGLLLWLGKRELLTILIVFAVVAVSTWTEILYEHFHNIEIDRFQTFWGRLGVFGLSLALFVLFRHLLYNAFQLFCRNLWKVLGKKGVLKAVFSFCVVWLSLLYLFALLYASAYAAQADRAFHVPREVSLGDFFYFSVVTATTLGYGDIYPTGTLTVSLSMAQVILSILTVSIYLGVVVSRVAQTE